MHELVPHSSISAGDPKPRGKSLGGFTSRESEQNQNGELKPWELPVLTPQQIQLRGQLAEVGLTMHAGGFYRDPFFPLGQMPVCAVWYESEQPSDEELGLLVEIAKEKISHFPHQNVKGFSADGANMITFWKKDGLWTYRRLTWESGIFSRPLRPLSELKESL